MPLSIKALTYWFQGSQPLDQKFLLPPAPIVGIWKKAKIIFHQLLLLTSFWAVSSQTLLSITITNELQFGSVQFSHSVMSDSLRPHESQYARPPCSSPTPGVHSDSRPSSPWCHPAISSSVVPFFSCPQSHSASESFPMSQLFAWGGQSTDVKKTAKTEQLELLWLR